MFVVATPGVPMVDAGAEAIPATAAAFDLVTVAQAFHWFDAPVALAEIARVLRPGGMLALIWNEREESDPVMAEFSRIISWTSAGRCATSPTTARPSSAPALFTRPSTIASAISNGSAARPWWRWRRRAAT